jgi:gluconokinase
LNNYILAVDIGTTSTKGLAVSSDGDVLASHQCYYPTCYPQADFAEQDPIQIYQAVLEVITKVIPQVPAIFLLKGISFSGAMHSIMAVDAHSKPLTQLIIWADTRSSAMAKQLRTSELGRQLHHQTGAPIHPMAPFCKLLWWRKHNPELIRTTHKFISMKEFVIHQLSGEYVVDYSIACASGMFNIHTLNWHSEVLRLTGVTNEQLSKPVNATYRCRIKSEIQKKFSLPDVPLVMGASDGCLAQLGSGAMNKNDLTITIGTSAAVRRVSKKNLEDPQLRLFNYLLDEKTFISGGASNNGTVIIDWFSREFNHEPQNLKAFVKDTISIPAGSDGLIALPYLQGERAPIYNAEARGVFFGVSVRHTPKHFKKALLESICFEILSIVKSVEDIHGPSDKIFVSGGFTYSTEWVQLLSDVLGRELIQSEVNDASAIGAAIIGFEAVGLSFQHQKGDRKLYKPDNDQSNHYQKQFERFELLYHQLEPLFNKPQLK